MYKDMDDGHRIGLTEDVMDHAKQVFEQGLQLEAILLAHEYLEQRLNALHRQNVHRKFKQMIDMIRISDEDYAILNEFNRLRNVNANQILNFSLSLYGAKKGDMIKAMNLAQESEQIITRLLQDKKKSRKKG